MHIIDSIAGRHACSSTSFATCAPLSALAASPPPPRREHVAQPSISKQLRLLERELGTPLFHRVGRRVVPTEAALKLADCADRVFDDLAATASLIADPGSAVGGTLRLCATETLTDHLLPAALSSSARKPDGAHPRGDAGHR